MYFQIIQATTPIWCGYYPSVAVTQGNFSVKLGNVEQGASATQSAPCSGQTLAVDPIIFAGMSPGTTVAIRVFVGGAQIVPDYPIATVPFAMNADRLDGYDSTDFAKMDAGSNVVSANGTQVISPTGRWMGG